MNDLIKCHAQIIKERPNEREYFYISKDHNIYKIENIFRCSNIKYNVEKAKQQYPKLTVGIQDSHFTSYTISWNKHKKWFTK